MPTPALEIASLSRRFGETVAVRNVSLAVDRGALLCLAGHSGCGKSSLLRLIAGVDAPDAGIIRIDGQEVAGPKGFVEPEQRRIGFVFQDYALFPHLTVQENVRFGLRGMARSDAILRAREMLDGVGLGGHAHRYPHELSGGEQQRVALARALAPSPRLILMDEPFSNLDRALREGVRRDTVSLIRELGTTAIIVSHDPEEALSLGDQVVLMRSGEIVQSGTAYDLYDRPNGTYAASFFAACNNLPGLVTNGHIETAIGVLPLAGRLSDGDRVAVLVRPSAIDVSPRHEGESLAFKVTARQMRGEMEAVWVAIPGLDVPLEIRSISRLPANVGHVAVQMRPEQAMIFKV
ncbi:iron(III) transport system ATP-binding protein [Pleomorphomonas diazotrophica]|nr:ABC transporter ATP-binding protein [Pleomorphomonas diazotrophica]SFM38006.1 iron(III) transport system ATP-binding protein [Pleomorphomonas diazotrophica]